MLSEHLPKIKDPLLYKGHNTSIVYHAAYLIRDKYKEQPHLHYSCGNFPSSGLAGFFVFGFRHAR